MPAKVLPTVGGKQFPWLAICSCVCVVWCGMRNYRLAWLTANALKTSQMSCQCLNVSTATTPSRRQSDAPPHPTPPSDTPSAAAGAGVGADAQRRAKRQRQRLECKIQLTCLSTHTYTRMHMHDCCSAYVCVWAINFMSNQAGNQPAAAAVALAPATAATAAAANETAAMPRKSHVDCPKPQPLKQMSTSFCICHLPHTCHTARQTVCST